MTSLASPELSTASDTDLAARLKEGRDHIITELRKRIIGQAQYTGLIEAAEPDRRAERVPLRHPQ